MIRPSYPLIYLHLLPAEKARACTRLTRLKKVPVPQAGEIAIVLDYHDQPVFVTRNTTVDIVPFNAVGADFATCEGEGDGSLAYWRAAHRDYFTRNSPELGITFNEDMLIVCERFEVLYALE